MASKAARVLMPPDHVKVTDLTELKENLADVLTEKQLEIAVLQSIRILQSA